MNRKISMTILVLFMLVFSFQASASSGIRNLLDRRDDSVPVEFSIQIEFKKLPQFSSERTEQLNKILKHVDFTGFVAETQSELSVRLDREALFTIAEEKKPDSQISILYSGLSDAYILPSETGIRNHFSAAMEDLVLPVQSQIDHFLLLDDYASLFGKLPAVFPEKTKDTKIAEKYRNYGTAVKRTTLILSGEEVQSFIQENSGRLSGCIYIPLINLHFESRQTVSLYYTEDGSLIKIVYSGKSGLSEDDMRNVKLEWKTFRTETQDRDDIVLKTPNAGNTKRNNIILSSYRANSDQCAETLQWKEEKDYLSAGIRTRSLFSADLTLENSLFTGSLSRTDTVRNSSVSEEIFFSCSAAENAFRNGILEINHKKDKIERDCLTVSFDFSSKGVPVVSDSRPEMKTLTEKEYKEMLQSVFSGVLKKLLMLPEEDLGFLKDGIPDDLWNTVPINGKN